jgi:archaemetzincin
MPAFMPMDLKVMIEPPEKLTDAAYDGSSGKYNAKALLTDLTNAITIDLRHESALFVVDVDLYTPESEFVFGLSSPPKRTAIMSLIRLRNEFYGLKPNRYKFLERAVKEAIHQMGHAWGLENCPDVKCVMHHSVNISDMDKYKSRFCTACRKKLYGMYRTPLLKGLPFL